MTPTTQAIKDTDQDDLSLNDVQSKALLREVQELVSGYDPLVMLSGVSQIYNSYIYHEHQALPEDFEEIAAIMVYLTDFLRKLQEILHKEYHEEDLSGS